MQMHDFASILRARCFVVFLQRLLVRALLGAFSCAALLPLLAGRLLLPPLAFCVRACVVSLVYPRILRVFGRFRSRPRTRALSCASSCVCGALVILAWLFSSPRAVCASRASCWLAICMHLHVWCVVLAFCMQLSLFQPNRAVARSAGPTFCL